MRDVSPQLHRPSQIGFENLHRGIGFAESDGSRRALGRASRPILGLLDMCKKLTFNDSRVRIHMH